MMHTKNAREGGWIRIPGNLPKEIRYFAPFVLLALLFMLLLSLGVSAAREKEAEGRGDEPDHFGEAIYVDGSAGNGQGGSNLLTDPAPGSADQSMDSLSADAVTLLLEKADGSTAGLSMEEYLTGVLLAEVSSSFGEEALKAQAVAARTYCLYRMVRGSGKKSHESGADVCSDYRHCMAYIDPADANPGDAAIMAAAAEATKGLCVIYTPTGALIDAVFHDSSHLCTESALSVWNSDIPYLRTVSSPEQCQVKSYEFTAEEIYKRTLGENALPEKDTFGGTTSNNAGRTERVLIGEKEFTALQLRSSLSLPSTAFTVLYDASAGLYRFSVRGYGHGVGLSQQGAAQMAKDGADFEQILRHYYSGCEVAAYVYEEA